ncbi:MAG: hypothetical protein IK130_01435 [Oscillospiraceae bacterium]|nr:hypothetical protein [Oscillospiraceae bacterium]
MAFLEELRELNMKQQRDEFDRVLEDVETKMAELVREGRCDLNSVSYSFTPEWQFENADIRTHYLKSLADFMKAHGIETTEEYEKIRFSASLSFSTNEAVQNAFREFLAENAEKYAQVTEEIFSDLKVKLRNAVSKGIGSEGVYSAEILLYVEDGEDLGGQLACHKTDHTYSPWIVNSMQVKKYLVYFLHVAAQKDHLEFSSFGDTLTLKARLFDSDDVISVPVRRESYAVY